MRNKKHFVNPVQAAASRSNPSRALRAELQNQMDTSPATDSSCFPSLLHITFLNSWSLGNPSVSTETNNRSDDADVMTSYRIQYVKKRVSVA